MRVRDGVGLRDMVRVEVALTHGGQTHLVRVRDMVRLGDMVCLR